MTDGDVNIMLSAYGVVRRRFCESQNLPRSSKCSAN